MRTLNARVMLMVPMVVSGPSELETEFTRHTSSKGAWKRGPARRAKMCRGFLEKRGYYVALDLDLFCTGCPSVISISVSSNHDLCR